MTRTPRSVGGGNICPRLAICRPGRTIRPQNRTPVPNTSRCEQSAPRKPPAAQMRRVPSGCEKSPPPRHGAGAGVAGARQNHLGATDTRRVANCQPIGRQTGGWGPAQRGWYYLPRAPSIPARPHHSPAPLLAALLGDIISGQPLAYRLRRAMWRAPSGVRNHHHPASTQARGGTGARREQPGAHNTRKAAM